MPSGFGFYHGRKPTAKEQRVLARLRPGKTPSALTLSTAEAVRKLAAANGVDVPVYTSGGGHDWRDRAIIAAVGLVVVGLIAYVAVRRLGRREAQPQQ
jgi:hypothetical protein